MSDRFVKLADLVPHPERALVHDLVFEDYEALRDSIREKGVMQPLILSENTILDGHHRHRAAKELGISEVVDALEGLGGSPLDRTGRRGGRMTPKTKRLTLEGFLRKYAKIAKQRGFREGLEIRDRYGCCPIVAVARSEGHRCPDPEDQIPAAEALGLDLPARYSIVSAADGFAFADYTRTIRARLLKPLAVK